MHHDICNPCSNPAFSQGPKPGTRSAGHGARCPHCARPASPAACRLARQSTAHVHPATPCCVRAWPAMARAPLRLPTQPSSSSSASRLAAACSCSSSVAAATRSAAVPLRRTCASHRASCPPRRPARHTAGVQHWAHSLLDSQRAPGRHAAAPQLHRASRPRAALQMAPLGPGLGLVTRSTATCRLQEPLHHSSATLRILPAAPPCTWCHTVPSSSRVAC